MSQSTSETCQCPAEAGADTCALAGSPSAVTCPECTREGKRVDALTLKALLAVSLTEMREVEYRFCGTQDCPVVYYTADQQQRFYEQDVRERVYQKHPSEGDVFVCYCFRHTVASIAREAETAGRSTVVATITTGIQAGRCACDIRNPQGSCCLGNVRNVFANLDVT